MLININWKIVDAFFVGAFLIMMIDRIIDGSFFWTFVDFAFIVYNFYKNRKYIFR